MTGRDALRFWRLGLLLLALLIGMSHSAVARALPHAHHSDLVEVAHVHQVKTSQPPSGKEGDGSGHAHWHAHPDIAQTVPTASLPVPVPGGRAMPAMAGAAAPASFLPSPLLEPPSA